MAKQSVKSDVSSIEGALAQAGQVSPMKQATPNKIASNEPKRVKGYEKLGTVSNKRSAPNDNRGEGA